MSNDDPQRAIGELSGRVDAVEENYRRIDTKLDRGFGEVNRALQALRDEQNQRKGAVLMLQGVGKILASSAVVTGLVEFFRWVKGT